MTDSTDSSDTNQHEHELPLQPTSGASPITLRSGATGSAVVDTVWAQVGGTETFDHLVRVFYDGVKADPLLAPMYPQSDWEGAIWRLRTFLEQYWGGPTTYSEERGHPRLRMRHAAFPVTPEARDRWLHHMNAALDEVQLPEMHDTAFRDYVQRAAVAMVNRLE
ncbi:MAG: globin [Leucobacter sp.]